MEENSFSKIRVEMIPEHIRPGEPGNLINKWEGDTWGANITTEHQGPGGEFDFGWFAYFSDKMKTAISTVTIERHDTPTSMTVKVEDSNWYAFMFGDGAEIGAEALIAKGHALDQFLWPWEDKVVPKDIPGVIIWYSPGKVYCVRVGEKFTPPSPNGY